MSQETVTKAELQDLRAKYVGGVQKIDERLAQLAQETEKLQKDRTATLGGIQTVDRLIKSIAEKVAVKEPIDVEVE